MFARLLLLRKIIPSFDVKQYVRGAIIKSGVVIIISTLGAWGLSRLLYNNVVEFFGVCLCSVICIPILSYLLALDSSEKMLVKQYICKVKSIVQTKIH
jgi:hypothetical protein